MPPLPFADLLPEGSTYYGILMGAAFLLAIYAHAARMPRLLLFAIMMVFLTTVLTMVAARGMQGDPGVPLP